jgi:hypothetical protein
MSFAARVREAAQRLKEFDVQAIGAQVGITTYEELDPIRWTIRDMRRSGEVEIITPGRYRYRAEKPMGRKNLVFRKMCRAMHIKGVFTAKEIQKRADGDVSYIRSVIRDFVRDGHLAETGHRRGSTRMELCYRVSDRDRFYLQFVK